MLFYLMLFSFVMFEHGSGVTRTQLTELRDFGLSGHMSLSELREFLLNFCIISVVILLTLRGSLRGCGLLKTTEFRYHYSWILQIPRQVRRASGSGGCGRSREALSSRA